MRNNQNEKKLSLARGTETLLRYKSSAVCAAGSCYVRESDDTQFHLITTGTCKGRWLFLPGVLAIENTSRPGSKYLQVFCSLPYALESTIFISTIPPAYMYCVAHEGTATAVLDLVYTVSQSHMPSFGLSTGWMCRPSAGSFWKSPPLCLYTCMCTRKTCARIVYFPSDALRKTLKGLWTHGGEWAHVQSLLLKICWRESFFFCQCLKPTTFHGHVLYLESKHHVNRPAWLAAFRVNSSCYILPWFYNQRHEDWLF